MRFMVRQQRRAQHCRIPPQDPPACLHPPLSCTATCRFRYC